LPTAGCDVLHERQAVCSQFLELLGSQVLLKLALYALPRKLGGLCPNCGGELLARPRRPASRLAEHPASTERIVKPAGCATSG